MKPALTEIALLVSLIGVGTTSSARTLAESFSAPAFAGLVDPYRAAVGVPAGQPDAADPHLRERLQAIAPLPDWPAGGVRAVTWTTTGQAPQRGAGGSTKHPHPTDPSSPERRQPAPGPVIVNPDQAKRGGGLPPALHLVDTDPPADAEGSAQDGRPDRTGTSTTDARDAHPVAERTVQRLQRSMWQGLAAVLMAKVPDSWAAASAESEKRTARGAASPEALPIAGPEIEATKRPAHKGVAPLVDPDGEIFPPLLAVLTPADAEQLRQQALASREMHASAPARDDVLPASDPQPERARPFSSTTTAASADEERASKTGPGAQALLAPSAAKPAELADAAASNQESAEWVHRGMAPLVDPDGEIFPPLLAVLVPADADQILQDAGVIDEPAPAPSESTHQAGQAKAPDGPAAVAPTPALASVTMRFAAPDLAPASPEPARTAAPATIDADATASRSQTAGRTPAETATGSSTHTQDSEPDRVMSTLAAVLSPNWAGPTASAMAPEASSQDPVDSARIDVNEQMPSPSMPSPAVESPQEDVPTPQATNVRSMLADVLGQDQAPTPKEMASSMDDDARIAAAVERVESAYEAWTRPAADPADAALTASPFGRATVAVRPERLDDVRGGFTTAEGLKISFGIERAVYVNGSLVATSSLNVSELGKITAGRDAGGALPASAAAVVQNGAGNTFHTGPVSATALGTVIQNTLNDQRIEGVTVINATVNSLGLLRSIDTQAAIRGAIVDTLRR